METNKEDRKAKYRGLVKEALGQFNNTALQRIIDHNGPMLLDGQVYDVEKELG